MLIAGLGAAVVDLVTADAERRPADEHDHEWPEQHHVPMLDRSAPGDEWQKCLQPTKSCHAQGRHPGGLTALEVGTGLSDQRCNRC